MCITNLTCILVVVAVYYVGPHGWKKMSGDDVGELHYSYYPVTEASVEAEMGDASTTSG